MQTAIDGDRRKPDQACGPLLDVSAYDVEHQVDAADVLQGIVLQIDELLRAEVERLRQVLGAIRR